MKMIDPGLPKELLPLGTRPAIHYTLTEGMDAGVEAIIVILRAGKEKLRAYVEMLGLPVTFLYQDRPAGEAEAIALAEPLVDDGSLAVVYPDNICLPSPGGLRLLYETRERQRIDVLALTRVTVDNETGFGNAGRVDLEPLAQGLYRIRRLAGKGAGHFRRRYPVELRACGMMACGTHVFDAIRRARPTALRGEFTDEPVRSLMLEERGLLGLSLPGDIYDVGNPRGYRRCLQAVDENGVGGR
jgi:UTP--glucose-1-phosphate uridylyltransferase